MSNPPAIRILPMSTRVPGFQNRSIADIQHAFFLQKLPKTGHFHYPSTGLTSPPGTLILFQFQAHIIASATLLKNEKFPTPKKGYKGVLHLDPASIRTFSPLDAAAMKVIWPALPSLGHAKHALHPLRYPAFLQAITSVRKP